MNSSFDNNINRNFNSQNQSFGNNMSDVAKAKYFYEDFVKKMDKSDFCNSSRRYIAELSYVRKLQEFYTEHNQKELLKEMTDRESTILEKLKSEFGITFKDNVQF